MELVESQDVSKQDMPKELSLKAQLEAEQAAQREAFGKEMEALIARYNVTLVPTLTIGDQQVAVAAVINFPVGIQVVSR